NCLEELREGRSDVARHQLRLKRGNGSWAWVDASIKAQRDADGRLLGGEGLMFDITETRLAEEKVAYLAGHDGLTGLANRAAFTDRLQHAWADAQRSTQSFAVLYLDIDHFKDINDAFGHEEGDQFLCALADRIAATVRQTDALGRFGTARFGGDEF